MANNAGRADISPVALAFMAKTSTKMIHNTKSDGQRLLYHGNTIAEHRSDGLWVTLAGFPTITTMHRLSALPGVDVTTIRTVVHLNGRPWDGEWVRVKNARQHLLKVKASKDPARLRSIWNPNGKWVRF